MIMKRIVTRTRCIAMIVCTAILFATAGWAQTNPVAQQFIEALEDHQYETAYALFSDEVKAQISLTQLEQIWRSLPSQAGTYQGHHWMQQQDHASGQLNIVRLQFANAEIDARLNINPSGAVEGFFLSPVARTAATP
ncbi:MAG: DUF3887 domain-containing protein, partial [Pseudomonadota bacterium]